MGGDKFSVSPSGYFYRLGQTLTGEFNRHVSWLLASGVTEQAFQRNVWPMRTQIREDGRKSGNEDKVRASTIFFYL